MENDRRPAAWCTASFLLRGSLVSVSAGLVIGLLLEIGASRFQPMQLFWAALLLERTESVGSVAT